ncbi:MAG TPA: RAMP superfamily CRISPR-associated protein [Methanothrix sp.]|mgnify:CR=1 FL=1|nr:RAMP superfamily CRISPR-associated protein [Methanothrix sp.]
MSHLTLRIDMNLQTPLHITGDRRLLGVDKASAMSAFGSHKHTVYTIPASSLKGRLRSRAEAILKSWDFKICSAPDPGGMCRDQSDLCLVCRVFGNPRFRSPIKFGEAKPPGDTMQEIRSGVAIGRVRGTALDQHLFFVETTFSDPSKIWIAHGDGHFPSPESAREAAALIILASRFNSAIGSGKSRGMGWISSQVKAKIDDQEVSDADLKEIWQRWAGGKE